MTTRITSSSKIAFVVSGQNLMHESENIRLVSAKTRVIEAWSRDIPNNAAVSMMTRTHDIWLQQTADCSAAEMEKIPAIILTEEPLHLPHNQKTFGKKTPAEWLFPSSDGEEILWCSSRDSLLVSALTRERAGQNAVKLDRLSASNGLSGNY